MSEASGPQGLQGPLAPLAPLEWCKQCAQAALERVYIESGLGRTGLDRSREA